ncbi:hypothetical protein [Streptomyces sp. Da 82-17]|uniref:hypothetical protein n=1 Tax=Streptomyces sp. Da 82-17 TaxID=3377116 RepID=UPI0038D37523
MSEAAGYGIRASQVSAAAGKLDTAANELDTIKSIIPADLDMPPAVLGGEEAAPAFNACADAWQRQATVLRDALREISGKLTTTTNNYTAAEQDAEAQLRRAAPAQAGLSDFN